MTQETSPKTQLHLPPATIVVAAALPLLGIGRGNALPWRIKAEMQYFKRVTTKVSERVLEYHHYSKVQNAVIMGRNTWASIPPKFRPLSDRLNVVVSNTLKTPADLGISSNTTNVLIASSLDRAFELLAPLYWKNHMDDNDHHRHDDFWIDKIFIIGGAQLYTAALEHPQTKAILLTTIEGVPSDAQLDTFFISRDNHALRSQFILQEQENNNIPQQEAAEWIRQDIQTLKDFIQISEFNETKGIQDELSYEYGLWFRS